MADYELWLTDDSGKRLDLLKNIIFFSYTRSVSRLGTINLGVPLADFQKKFNPYFRPDWRVEVWRTADSKLPLYRDDIFFLRKPTVYLREDGMEVLQFHGRNGIDLLKRRTVPQTNSTYTLISNAHLDDIMKTIVRTNLLYGSARDELGALSTTRALPVNEFLVEPDTSEGPLITRTFGKRNIFDVLDELKKTSLQKNHDDSTQRRIYFDVAPIDVSGLATQSGALTGFEFQTRADQYGMDRTADLEFSVANGKISNPEYSLSYLDEFNSIFLFRQGPDEAVTNVADLARIQSSRWNRSEKVATVSGDVDTGGITDLGNGELDKGKPIEKLDVTFLNTPGNEQMPRSLLGVDWNLGDRVTVAFAGKLLEVEIDTVYVAVDENGKETITGRNLLQA